MMNRETIPGIKNEVRLCLLQTVTVADTNVEALATQLDLAGHWLEQYTAPVRAKPNSMPRLDGALYKYPTSCSFTPI